MYAEILSWSDEVQTGVSVDHHQTASLLKTWLESFLIIRILTLPIAEHEVNRLPPLLE